MNNRGVIKIILFIISIIILLLVGITTASYYWLKNNGLEKIVQNEFVKKQVGEENQDLLKLAPSLLGFDAPKTYLVLFANNTELRPGGGFIGVYAVIRMNKGRMEILALDGTENLDKNAPENWRVEPPGPLKQNLKVDRWYFRDSNWSPDFAESAKKALEFYKAEGGVAADEIQTVVAFTPTVLEELMKITGPFTIQNIEFTADNVTEKLEYEVEYGYDDKGIVRTERKQIIRPFILALLEHLKGDLFSSFSNYLALLDKMGKEKQIMFYFSDDTLQKVIVERDWSGEMKNTDSDYLLWVDANLAALKTDHAIERSLRYVVRSQEDGRFLATVEMTYQHKGKFDWRTTRYRTYARVFVPLGSELASAEGFDQGEELGKKWFGAFISIEPGETKSLSFSYFLPATIGEQIKNNTYTLFVQKQLGALTYGLTLNLNSGKTISTDLRVDREFKMF